MREGRGKGEQVGEGCEKGKGGSNMWAWVSKIMME
jgi:hypothetical protein